MAAWFVALTACGDKKLSCSKDDRHGTYYVDYTTKSGDCGEIYDEVVNSDDPGAGSSADCAVDYEHWSSDECELSRSVTCTDTANGVTGVFVSKTDQIDSSGDALEGIATVTIRDTATGSLICVGTYDLEFTRQ